MIFDEIVTGFRWALGGAQKILGVTPDLATFGKAMANGMPIAVLVGRKEFAPTMEKIFYSFTFAGETLSLAASMAVIDYMKQNRVIEFLWRQGEKMMHGYDEAARRAGLDHITRCSGVGPRHVMLFEGKDEAESLLLKSFVQQECIKRGYLFYGCHNMALAHDDEICEQVLAIYEEVLSRLAQALDEGGVAEKMEGDPIVPIFRRV